MKFVKFKHGDGTPVFVNPAMVKFIMQYRLHYSIAGKTDATEIIFGESGSNDEGNTLYESVVVSEKIETVVRKLEQS